MNSTQLTEFEHIPPERIVEIKKMFKTDYEKNIRHYTLMLSADNCQLYLYVIKEHIPWVTAKKLSERQIEIWIKSYETVAMET